MRHSAILVTVLMRLRAPIDPSTTMKFRAVILLTGRPMTKGQGHRGARLVEAREEGSEAEQSEGESGPEELDFLSVRSFGGEMAERVR